MGQPDADQTLFGHCRVEPLGEVRGIAPATQWRGQDDHLVADDDRLWPIGDDDVCRQGQALEPTPWRLCDRRIVVTWQ